jgi:hypothetical protein
MASFPNLRTTNARPSDASEGVRVRPGSELATGAFLSAAGTVVTLSELATPRVDSTVNAIREVSA